MSQRPPCRVPTGWSSKNGTVLLNALTLSNINRFSKFFHCQNFENRLIFDKVKRFNKNCAIFGPPTLYLFWPYGYVNTVQSVMKTAAPTVSRIFLVYKKFYSCDKGVLQGIKKQLSYGKRLLRQHLQVLSILG